MAKIISINRACLQALRQSKPACQWRLRFFRRQAEHIFCLHSFNWHAQHPEIDAGRGYVWHKAFRGIDYKDFVYDWYFKGDGFYCYFYFKGMLICIAKLPLPKSNLAWARARACGKWDLRLAYFKNKQAKNYKKFWGEVKKMRQSFAIAS